jgi:D-glycero-alpha-D-manno-heptose-7-phosphate kinase
LILSRAPVRITLGGGGTDLASYYSEHEGFLIAGAINRYVHIALNRRFSRSYRLSYSKTEIVESISQIEHRIFKATYELTGVDKLDYGLEAVSIADIPANCGLGSSGAFTVSLLNALHSLKRESAGIEALAEEACRIEIDMLKEPIGKQDQYMAACGGLTCLTFQKNGKVIIEPLKLSRDGARQFESKILLFYTNIERKASDVLRDQSDHLKQKHSPTVDSLHQIKKIGYASREALESGNFDRFGELLNEHWEFKKRLSTKITDPFIDDCYKIAMKSGAKGGKLIGAGGGGFLMFYCPENQAGLMEKMKERGLAWMPFRFDFEGAKIMANFDHE